MREVEPGHAALLTIDLDALAANWRFLAQRMAPGTDCAAVVKGDAYGTGIERAVPALVRAGCKTFFVAHLSEGLRTRIAAPEATIYVLNGYFAGTADGYQDARLRPVLGSGEEIADWLRESPDGPAAIHVDTGMNRLGLSRSALAAVEADGALARLRPSLVMSHLLRAEDPDHMATSAQITAFTTVRDKLQNSPTSLYNSYGMFLPDAPSFELARPGYALFGGNPSVTGPNPMRPVVRLEAPIIGVRSVPAGATVGYGGVWTARRDSRIATISVGYADGYPRSASATDAGGGGLALIDGVPCPFAGRVSMDLITIDVTGVPDTDRGSIAVLIGDELDVDTVGARAGTIGYEILTGLGRRYRRRYVGGE